MGHPYATLTRAARSISLALTSHFWPPSTKPQDIKVLLGLREAWDDGLGNTSNDSDGDGDGAASKDGVTENLEICSRWQARQVGVFDKLLVWSIYIHRGKPS